MNTRTTHISIVRREILSNQEEVMRLLGWDLLTYCEFKYESGLKYLRLYIPEDPHSWDQLERNKIFWNWWKLHWSKRENTWLTYASRVPYEKRLVRYFGLHNPNTLAKEISITGKLLGETYADMIAEVCKIPA